MLSSVTVCKVVGECISSCLYHRFSLVLFVSIFDLLIDIRLITYSRTILNRVGASPSPCFKLCMHLKWPVSQPCIQTHASESVIITLVSLANFPAIPTLSMTCYSCSLSIESSVWRKSTSTATLCTLMLYSQVLLSICYMVSSWSIVDLPCLKPVWYSPTIFFVTSFNLLSSIQINIL